MCRMLENGRYYLRSASVPPLLIARSICNISTRVPELPSAHSLGVVRDIAYDFICAQSISKGLANRCVAGCLQPGNRFAVC